MASDVQRRADRRANRSTTLSEALERAVRFCELHGDDSQAISRNDAIEDPSSSPKDVIRRTLSVKSVVSTSSSFTEPINAARYNEEQFRCIGTGSCGTVWEQPGTEIAFKTSPQLDALWADFHITNRVRNAFIRAQELMENAFPGITVPRVPSASCYFTPSNSW